MAKERLIVGLGNPGAEYARTRHNVGFEVADAVAERANIPLRSQMGRYELGEGRWRSRALVIAKPLQYMNRSGEAVIELLRRFSLTPAEVLVVYDDLALPSGTIRLRQGGSAGGHNGVQDIIDHLKTEAFPRLRVGIGSDFPRGHQVDYVLSPFDPVQRPVIDDAVVLARDASLTFVTEGLTTAMNRFNQKNTGERKVDRGE